MLIGICIIFSSSLELAQKTETKPESATINIQKARAIIENIDKQFAQDYFNGDSIALAAHYANDAQVGCLKGKEIQSYRVRCAAWFASITYLHYKHQKVSNYGKQNLFPPDSDTNLQKSNTLLKTF